MPLKFKKASADEVQAKRKEHVKDVGSGSAVLKGFKAPPSWNDNDRSARFTMSSESVDRYRDIVVQAGIDTTAFERNPQGLLFHNSRSWPIGIWSDITKILSGRPKRTEGTLTFLPEGTDEDADRAARHVKAGSMRTVSIGFIPDWEDVDFILDEDDDWTGGFRFNTCELLECSVVPIPAQPDALVKDAAGDMKLARDLIEDILDSYSKTPEGLLVPLDLYREKHFELGGNRSAVVVDKAFLPETKAFVPKDDQTLKAATEAEAKEFVGASVTFDPGHAENKGWPFEDLIQAKATGEVISSYIVDHGEFKGVHGLAVEFLTDDFNGMFRGIKAERFLLVKTSTETSSEGEEKDTPVTDKVKPTDIVEKTVPPIEIKIETNLAETKKEVEELESAVDRVFGKIAKLFGRSKDTSASDRTDPPELTTEPEVRVPEIKAPPTEDEVSAARARAAEVRARLAAKGMIAAE